MKKQYDVVIIGAGVVGSAIARELSRYKLSIAVLEKNLDVCNETSGRNSAVVHGGFASLGDIMLAEPGALIGFAGPRVIEQTIGEKLPAGFQRSEFQMEHGFVDQVVPRSQLRDTLIQVLQLHAGGKHE